MSHLSRDERLLALDGVLAPPRQAHLAACSACATEVEALAGVLARVRAVDVPEPSPLFWDHLAARVGDAIAREPAPRRSERFWVPRLGWAAAALVVVASGAAYVARTPPPPAMPVAAHATVPAAASGPSTAALAGTTDALPSDDGWALIAAVAEQSDDDALTPQIGQAELSLSALSAEERRALASELAAELAPAGVREG